jgi:hypothetical protein
MHSLVKSFLFFISLRLIELLSKGSLRDYPPSLEYIVKYDGFGVLLSAMQSNIEKLQIKAAFLLSALCSESNAVRGEFLLLLKFKVANE